MFPRRRTADESMAGIWGGTTARERAKMRRVSALGWAPADVGGDEIRLRRRSLPQLDHSNQSRSLACGRETTTSSERKHSATLA